MEQNGVQVMSGLARQKLLFFHRHTGRHFVYAMLAGVFCGLGMILAYTSGGLLDACEATRGFSKIVFGISFTLSFTMIVYAGSELFTGDVMVMTIGCLNRAVPAVQSVKMMCFVYLGNFCGAVAIASLIWAAGLLDSAEVGSYMVSATAVKMSIAFVPAVCRGILCNMMVCLATWSTGKLSSEPAKMLILVWCVYCFCTAGFEHSIANMALFAMALLSPWADASVTLVGAVHNLIPVTLGNLIGGGLIIGGAYYFVGSARDLHPQ